MTKFSQKDSFAEGRKPDSNLLEETHEFLKRHDLLPIPGQIFSSADVVTVVAAAICADRAKRKERA